MSQLTELRKAFLQRFKNELAIYGFRKSDQIFYRKADYGKDIIRFEFYMHPGNYFAVGITIGVRHEAVETIRQEFTPMIPKELLPWITTIGNRIENLYRHVPGQNWYVSDENSLDDAIDKIMVWVKERFLPYFERFSSLEEVLAVMSAGDEIWTPHCSSIVLRADVVVTAAFLLGKKEDFERLAKEQLEYVEENGRFSSIYRPQMPGLIALIDSLRARLNNAPDVADS